MLFFSSAQYFLHSRLRKSDLRSNFPYAKSFVSKHSDAFLYAIIK